MLLTSYTDTIWKSAGPWLVSEKLDGWRMVYDGNTDLFYSRSGEILNVPRRIREAMDLLNPERLSLDGELYIGRGRFNQISGALATGSDALVYCVFDTPAPNGKAPYEKRYQQLKKLNWSNTENAPIQLVEQKEMDTDVVVCKMMRDICNAGGEGVVIRHANAPYVPGRRSNQCLKYKPIDTDSVTVIGYHCTETAKTEPEGYVSSLICQREASEKTFKVSWKSFSPPAIGSTVRIQYQSTTVNNLPRFAVLVHGVGEDAPRPHTPPRQGIPPVDRNPPPAPKKKTITATTTTTALERDLTTGMLQGDIVDWEKVGGYALVAGESVWVRSSTTQERYKVTRAASDPMSVYCSCPAWKFQRLTPRVRTCKHCIAVCGDVEEKRRVAQLTLEMLECNATLGTKYKV